MPSDNPTPKYSSAPDEEIIGAAILAVSESQNLYDFEDLVQKYGYDQAQPDKWYSAETAMAFLRELAERDNNMSNLVSIGMKVFDVLPVLDEVDNIPDGLRMINVMAQASQRNADFSTVWYQVNEIDEHNIEMVDRGPYPHDLLYGEIYSLCRRLKPAITHFVVERDYLNSDDPDADGAVYRITITPE